MIPAMRFLRVIRFDMSDDHVFDRTAMVDEWAVSGGFAFAGLEDDDIKGKTRQAFANGFLGLPSFGRSTFAVIAPIEPDEYEAVVSLLADHLIAEYGAPGPAEAKRAAEDECGFVADLCRDQPVNTVFTVRRVLEGGDIREQFRNVSPPGEPQHAPIWDVVEDNG
jgi:hypothetical protein